MLTMFCGRVSAECSEVMDGDRETVVGNECVEEEDKSRSKKGDKSASDGTYQKKNKEKRTVIPLYALGPLYSVIIPTSTNLAFTFAYLSARSRTSPPTWSQ